LAVTVGSSWAASVAVFITRNATMKAKVTPITITVDGVEHKIFKRRLKYRERTRLAGILRDGIHPVQKLDADGQPIIGANGVPEEVISIPIERFGAYRLELLHLSLCNGEGKSFFTRDEIDEWETEDIDRIVDQVERDNRLGDEAVEAAKGNSEATPDEGSSSTSA
jgi:hypothetical protein